MELDLPFGDSKHFSISNGEVSYGDEPVSNRKSRTTGSRESSYRSDESQSQSSGIDQETPRLSGQWFYLMNSPHSVPTFTSSSVNFHNSPDGSQGRSNLNTTNSIAYNTTSNATHNLLSRIDLPPNNTNRQSINYPTNFKPLTSIEKSDDSNSRLVLESSLSNSRPTDPAVSTNSLTSHKPVHIISSSSIGPGSYTELSPITQNPHGKMPTKKRKDELGGAPKAKKQKGNKIVIKSKRVPKSKAEKPEPVGKHPFVFVLLLSRYRQDTDSIRLSGCGFLNSPRPHSFLKPALSTGNSEIL
jgi:hypothetical protein